MNRGTLAVVSLVLLSVLLVLGGLWYRRTLSRPIIDWWGIEAVELLRTAPTAELLVFEHVPRGASDAGAEERVIGGERYVVRRRVDVSHYPGLTHLRHALLERVSYRFDVPVRRPLDVRYGLRLESAGRAAEFLFDRGQHVVADRRGHRAVVLGPVHERMMNYFAEAVAAKGTAAEKGALGESSVHEAVR